LYKQSQEFGEKLREEVSRATKELAVANMQLKDVDQAKSEFLNIASHQLYTPLTALRGYLSMLREGDFGTIPEKQQPIVEIFQKSTLRLIELVRNLLDISRIESGRLELNIEQINLAKMVEDTIKDIMPNALHKKLKLYFDTPKIAVNIVGDSQRLRQVIVNIIDNAIKYTEKGRITVTVTQEGEEALFQVTDTGRGMTGEEMVKLFHKFIRGGGAQRVHTEGSGLGLYVAKQIVREHHGDISADSPGLGKGSTFVMRLPIAGTMRSLKVGEKTMIEVKSGNSEA
jgi:signal transduction histidine kinase